MKKTLLAVASVFMMLTHVEVKAQLADGSIAPNWTFTDLNGTSHTLYDYLDQGKTVFIDVSAAWCGPCWNYHNTHALRDLYEQHGPTGFPNVSPSTTNDVMVFFIEGEQDNTGAQLTGTSGSGVLASQGDWVTGTTYPIIDLPNNAAGNTFMSGYEIGYFPTVYMICPNRVIKETGQVSASAQYTQKGTCPAPASQPIDAALLQYLGGTETCVGGSVSLKVRLQNNGLSPLTSATITAMNGATQVGQTTFNGNLTTYAVSDVTIGTTTVNSNANLTFTVTATSDANSGNNGAAASVTTSSAYAGGNNITVKITTDRYGSETTWRIVNSAGTSVLSGGPYSNASSNGAYPQPDVSGTLPNDCYRLEIFDAYGDGFTGAYGNGSIIVMQGTNEVIKVNNFTTEEYKKSFKTGPASTGIEEEAISGIQSLNVFPNPFKDEAQVAFNLNESAAVNISLVNVLGEQVYSLNNNNMTAGNHIVKINGSELPSGLYFVNFTLNGNTVTRKMIK